MNAKGESQRNVSAVDPEYRSLNSELLECGENLHGIDIAREP